MKDGLIDFDFQFSVKSLEELLSMPKCSVGIFKNEPVLDYEENLRSLANVGKTALRVNEMGTFVWKDGKNRSYRVGDFFISVLKKTPLLKKYFQDELNKTGANVFSLFLRSNQTKIDYKKYQNGILAIFRKSYVKMAMRNKCSLHREEQKGHALYGIGTGQTLMSIEGRAEIKK